MNFNKEEFKKRQEMAWNRMAQGWKKWWPVFESEAKLVSENMITFAQINSGDRVLDLATGIGEPAITIAQKVGSNGEVFASDISEQMLNIAEERVKDLNIHNIKFIKSDISKLNLDKEKPFDTILCRFGLMLIPVLETTISLIYDYLDKGGYFVATVFPEPSKAPIVGHTVFSIQQIVKPPTPDKKVPGIFALADPTPVVELLKKSGFKEIKIKIVQNVFKFDDAIQFRDFTRDITPPINMTIQNTSEELIEKMWEFFVKSASEKYTKNNKIELPSDIINIIAKK